MTNARLMAFLLRQPQHGPALLYDLDHECWVYAERLGEPGESLALIVSDEANAKTNADLVWLLARLNPSRSAEFYHAEDERWMYPVRWDDDGTAFFAGVSIAGPHPQSAHSS